jgi:CheY-like chemotaxis protein/anti-sigma regulatory factor (Ser/Thr protein kinase)
VAIDATEWHQLVMNLATNAVQALPEAKGRVEIRVEPGTLAEPRARRRAVRLSIRDDGCGMTADVVARCRDPYFTTKPSGVGTGMGLSIVHGIVSSLGGRLEVDSEPDVGTTIQVLVPAAVAAAAPGPDAPPDATPAGDPARSCPEAGADRPATIMVVEDERAILDLAAAALGRRRYAVRTFADPQEALAAFCDDPRAVDLVITDQTMPGMTGADLTRELLAIRADLPVIVCSGHSPSFGPAEAREVGARAYLAKPVPLGELLAAVGRELAPAAAD